MSPAKTTNAPDRSSEIASMRIELRHTRPPIWRMVEAPTSITLHDLHDIVQIAMGWFDCHLWEFATGGRTYGLPMDDDWGTKPRKEAAKVRLRDVLSSGRTVIDYTYDFGDGWEHRIIVADVRPSDPGLTYPRYVAGKGNGPPEDCGGLPGFYSLLDAKADPDHPEHDHAEEVLEDYDPDVIDEAAIREAFDRLATRGKA
jgi:hypothetical protein